MEGRVDWVAHFFHSSHKRSFGREAKEECIDRQRVSVSG